MAMHRTEASKVATVAGLNHGPDTTIITEKEETITMKKIDRERDAGNKKNFLIAGMALVSYYTKRFFTPGYKMRFVP